MLDEVENQKKFTKKFPWWFYVAIAVNLISWAVSWLHIEPYFFFMFIFLIGSYIFILDGINYYIKSTSLLDKNWKAYIFVWILSSLFWWYFEFAVLATKNWYYLTTADYPNIVSIPLASLYFTTVLIGVMEIFEIIKDQKCLQKIAFGKIGKKSPLIIFALGIISIILTIVRPDIFFPFMWLSLFFILDPINYWLGFDSLIKDAIAGKWKRIVGLAISSIAFFFFWEMWNYGNDPKWVYEVPYVGFAKVFEMPILGYGGYLPFGLEIFAFYSFFQGLLKYPPKEFFGASGDKKNAKKAFCAVIIALIISNLALYKIKEFYNSPDKLVSIRPTKMTSLTTQNESRINGGVYISTYAFFDGSCLETNNGSRYWLLNKDRKRIKVAPGEYAIEGIIEEQTVGMDNLIVTEIYKTH